MKADIGVLFGGILAAAVLTGTVAEGKRLAPKEVVPVVADGVQYTVPHFGAFHGRSQNGGYVDAKDVKTRRLIWSRMIYRVQYDLNQARDGQDVFITKIKVKRGRLLVKTERAEEFEMDLSSGLVRALTPLGTRIEVPTGVPQGDFSNRKSWALAYLRLNPGAEPLQMIGDYNATPLGTRLGYFSLDEARAIATELASSTSK